ncbi:MAG: Cys-tRNA(Pro) deacylase [Oscillospiraceae bacterium]|nr:Cys-tRNA(Pro) deacylase [Oscillospiraceae bacterium]
MAKSDKNAEKTNVMRILDQKKINYRHYCYADTSAVSGIEVAEILGQNPEQVFKTLVTVSGTGAHYVFVIPVAEELDLKKSAKAVGEKSIAMLKSKELLPLTGYIHGGCSPIGMKKFFPTVIDETAEIQETIIFSAGKIGYQVELSPEDLKQVIDFQFADITV